MEKNTSILQPLPTEKEDWSFDADDFLGSHSYKGTSSLSEHSTTARRRLTDEDDGL